MKKVFLDDSENRQICPANRNSLNNAHMQPNGESSECSGNVLSNKSTKQSRDVLGGKRPGLICGTEAYDLTNMPIGENPECSGNVLSGKSTK